MMRECVLDDNDPYCHYLRQSPMVVDINKMCPFDYNLEISVKCVFVLNVTQAFNGKMYSISYMCYFALSGGNGHLAS